MDDANEWTVHGINDAEISAAFVETFEWEAREWADSIKMGYVPNYRNVYAYAILRAYPGSRILSGLYPAPRSAPRARYFHY